EPVDDPRRAARRDRQGVGRPGAPRAALRLHRGEPGADPAQSAARTGGGGAAVTQSDVWIKFAGWFQCRLATDPDPCDEPRGVSGYVRAVAGEPDLDRIIRLQPKGTTPRSHCPALGVSVVAVFGDARHAPASHPLLGATVELLDDPKFEGRNHILAEDGVEAIVPCHLRIRKGRFVAQRKF